MSFLALPFLFAAAAAAVPVVLHMVFIKSRRKAKDLPFATLRFLRISAEKTRRRKRIHDLLLLLVRMAVLILIAVGLARPTLTSLPSIWGGGHWAVVIVLDNSASMGTIDQGRSRDEVRFRSALRAAEQIMDQLEEGDQVALLLTGGPELPEQGKLSGAHEKARQMLNQWIDSPLKTSGVSYQRADLALKVRQARELLAKSEAANKHVYVLTDLQKLSWEGLEEESAAEREDTGADDVPIILVDFNRAPKPNVAITGVDLLDVLHQRSAMPIAGQPIVAAVELFGAAPVAQPRHLELYVDGVKQSSSPALNVPPGGRLTHEIRFTFEHSGLRRGEVVLVGEDGSKLDDRWCFTMEVNQGIPVALVKPRRHEIPYLEDTFYIEQALAPGKSGDWAIRLDTITAADLASRPLGDYRVIFCVNLPAPQGAAARRLRSYVAGGGNLVWICGDNVDPDAYNRMNQQAGGQLLPLPLLDVRAPQPGDGRESFRIGFLDKEHPALTTLLQPASLYRSVLIYRHLRMAEDDASGARVMARLDDERGEPLLVEKSVQRGKVLLLGTGAHLRWSNLPLRPIFLPLLVHLTFDLAGAGQDQHQTLAGSPLVFPLEDPGGSGHVEVQRPDGETIRRQAIDEEGRPLEVFRYEDTHRIGIYVLRLLQGSRPVQIGYAVNPDPDEADPAKIERERLQEHFGSTSLVFADDPDDLSGTFDLLRQGKSLWELFLLGVLIALVFETFLANRLSPKHEEAPGQRPPPGMRRLARRGRGAA